MTHNEIIGRFREVLTLLKGVNPEHFNYADYVTKAEEINGTVTGVVCCIAGYYPKWFPDRWAYEILNLRYAGLKEQPRCTIKPLLNSDFTNIVKGLAEFHGVNVAIVHAIFHGAGVRLTSPYKPTLMYSESSDNWYSSVDDVIQFVDMLDITHAEVVERFERIIKLLVKKPYLYKPTMPCTAI